VGGGQHCSQEKRMLILKLRKEGKALRTFKKLLNVLPKWYPIPLNMNGSPKTVVPNVKPQR